MMEINKTGTMSANGTKAEGAIPCMLEIIGYDSLLLTPIKVTHLSGAWWIVSPGECLMPLDHWLCNESAFYTLCKPGEKIDVWALAQVLGAVFEMDGTGSCDKMRSTITTLKRLGALVDVEGEPLELELRFLWSSKQGAPKLLFMECNGRGYHVEPMFIIRDCDTRQEAEARASRYFDFLCTLGVELTVTAKS